MGGLPCQPFELDVTRPPKISCLLTYAPRLSDLYVFPGPPTVQTDDRRLPWMGQIEGSFRQSLGVASWQLRDLRRTFATNLQGLGVRLEVTVAHRGPGSQLDLSELAD